MWWRPRRCPNCRIPWSDRARSGVCDLCGYDLALGGQPAPATGSAAGRAESAAEFKAQRGFGREGYRPFLPGVEVSDPMGLLSAVDPMVLSELQTKMGAILGRQAEQGGRGRLPAKRMEHALALLARLARAVPEGNADLFVDSQHGELPIRISVRPRGERAAQATGRRLAPAPAASGEQGRWIAKFIRVLIFLGFLAYLFVKYFLQHR